MASARIFFVTTLHVKLCTFRQNPSPLHVSWGTSPPAGKAVSGEPKHDRKPPRLAHVLGLSELYGCICAHLMSISMSIAIPAVMVRSTELGDRERSNT